MRGGVGGGSAGCNLLGDGGEPRRFADAMPRWGTPTLAKYNVKREGVVPTVTRGWPKISSSPPQNAHVAERSTRMATSH